MGRDVSTELGEIEVHDDVISAIASYETSRIAGVVGMNEGIADGIKKKLGGGGSSRGVVVRHDEYGKIFIDISLVVVYGINIPELCRKVQEAVLSGLRTMLDASVTQINVHVQDVQFPEAEGEADDEEGSK